MRFVPGIRDIRGRESTTLFFVYISWLLLVVKFAVGGFETPFGTMPVIGATEFGIAVTAILAIWTAREYKEKDLVQKQNENEQKQGIL
jgi:hypothetical protein